MELESMKPTGIELYYVGLSNKMSYQENKMIELESSPYRLCAVKSPHWQTKCVPKSTATVF